MILLRGSDIGYTGVMWYDDKQQQIENGLFINKRKSGGEECFENADVIVLLKVNLTFKIYPYGSFLVKFEF